MSDPTPRQWSNLPPHIQARLSVVAGGHWHFSGADQVRPRVKWRGKVVDVSRLLAGLLGRPDVRLQRRCADPSCVNPGAGHADIVPWLDSMIEARRSAHHPSTVERVLRAAGIEPEPDDYLPESRRERRAERMAAFEDFHYGAKPELLPRLTMP